MTRVFLVSVVLMFVHKVECWVLHEWLELALLPVDLRVGRHPWPRTPEDAFGEAVFLSFISWLFAGLLKGALILWGGWGPFLALGVWGLTGILEWHHLLKSMIRGEYYVGLGTSLAYLGFMFYFWYELVQQVDWSGQTEEG